MYETSNVNLHVTFKYTFFKRLISEIKQTKTN